MSNGLWEVVQPVATAAGMCGLWQPQRFEHIDSLESREDEISENDPLGRHVAEGAFVPINIGGGGSFQMSIRNFPRSADEVRYTLVSSAQYLLVSEGVIFAGGIENIGSYIGGGIEIPVESGRYSVTVHLVDWKAQTGAVLENGDPSENALSDFVVEVTPAAEGSIFRKSLETFERI